MTIIRKSPGGETFFIVGPPVQKTRQEDERAKRQRADDTAGPRAAQYIRCVERSTACHDRPVLDDDGCLLFGKHKGESAANLARTRMGRQYLLWVLDNVEYVNEDDQVIIEALIDRYS